MEYGHHDWTLSLQLMYWERHHQSITVQNALIFLLNMFLKLCLTTKNKFKFDKIQKVVENFSVNKCIRLHNIASTCFHLTISTRDWAAKRCCKMIRFFTLNAHHSLTGLMGRGPRFEVSKFCRVMSRVILSSWNKK